MKKNINKGSYTKKLLLFLLVLLMLLITGCTTTEPMAEPIIKEEGSQGFLWKVENKDNVVYLLGSIHVGKEDMYPLRSTILKAYEEADYVYVEVDLLRVLGAKERSQLSQLMLLQEGKTLKDVVPDELYQSLEEKLKYLDYNVEDLALYKPGSVTSLITNAISREWIEEYNFGVDKYFISKANKDNKEIIELEGRVYLSTMQDSYTIELQNALLKDSLNLYAEDIKASIEDAIDSWINGDKEQFLGQGPEYFEGQQNLKEEYHDKMLRKRNERVTDIIQDLLEGDEGRTYFVVYGAGHFVMEDNVIEMLKQKGYKVIEQ